MSTYQQIVDSVRQQGERLTIQRRLVIEALTDTGEHMSIPQIQQHITHTADNTEIPEPTIYRILQWLKELHIVSQTDIAANSIVYQIIDDTPHHHLICLNCGKAQDIDDAPFEVLRQTLYDDYGFRPRIDHMAIYGTCADCAADTHASDA